MPNVSVKVLNWMTPTITTHDNQRYSWEEGDMNQLKKASYIIAADGMDSSVQDIMYMHNSCAPGHLINKSNFFFFMDCPFDAEL